jgi:hypothetical protein
MTKQPIVFRSGIVAPAEGKKRRAIVKADPPPVPTWQEAQAASYLERMAEQRRLWKEQDQARFYNPDADPDRDGIWNVYVWMTYDSKLQRERWHYVGQRDKKTKRRKTMTLNRLFAGIRQALNIPKDRPVKLISAQDDAARKRRGEVWELEPPKHHETLAPWTPPKEAMKLRELPPPTKTKIRKDTSPKVQGEPKLASTGRVVGFTFKTRYVAWGKRQGSAWVYLGPCIEQKKVSAKKEIRDRFPLYPDPVIVAVKDLTYSMRSRLRDGRLKPGTTKVPLPKVNS